MAMPLNFSAPPAGLIIDLVTPLTAAGTLDGPGLDRLLARVLPFSDGLLAGSPLAGEGLELPRKIREELLSHLLAAVAGQVPLFFAITGDGPEETKALAAWVREEIRRRDYQSPFFLADLPLWHHSNRGLPQYYRSLLAATELPLLLLNLPLEVRRRGRMFKHLNIRTQVFKKVADLPGVLGLIYQGEMRRFLHYHHAAATRPGFAFYETDEVRFLTRPGAWGAVSGTAQILPRVWQGVARACLHPEETADDPARRYSLWDQGNRLQQVSQFCGPRPANLWKQALARQGIISSPAMASGTSDVKPEDLEKFFELLAGFAE